MNIATAGAFPVAAKGANDAGPHYVAATQPRRPHQPPSTTTVRTDDELQRCYVSTLQTLADTRARAERAERRLRSRLAQLTWPAALSGLAGGSAIVLGLRLAGF